MVSDASTGTDGAEPGINQSGVDLVQIRAMLDLSPAERLARMAEFLDGLLAIRALNAPGGDA
jgi:hypothetical protein